MGKSITKLKVTDKGYKGLIVKLKKLEKTQPRLTVGVHAEEGAEATKDDSDVTVLDVANWMEHGTEDIPARSFLAAWADENQAENEAAFRKVAVAVVQGKIPSIEVGLERLGLKFVGDIQRRIKAHIPPPNAESTIQKKGSSTPLIDDGQLWTSITHRVTK